MKSGDLLFWYPAKGEPWPSPGNMAFWCPACQEEHAYQLGHGHNWEFDGNFESPTFSPSLLIFERELPFMATKCHLFVRGGQIDYCSDCPHELAGRTVPMVPWDEATNYWHGVTIT